MNSYFLIFIYKNAQTSYTITARISLHEIHRWLTIIKLYCYIVSGEVHKLKLKFSKSQIQYFTATDFIIYCQYFCRLTSQLYWRFAQRCQVRVSSGDRPARLQVLLLAALDGLAERLKISPFPPP